MKTPSKRLIVLLAVAAVLLIPLAAQADTITWGILTNNPLTVTGASDGLKAEAIFTLNSGVLTVLLKNTATAASDGKLNQGSELTALFFTPSASLTPVSASLINGSNTAIAVDPLFTVPGGNVGGEWAYGGGLSGAPLSATAGISSAGFGIFGNGNFNGPNLAGPANPHNPTLPGAVDGGQFGLVSHGTTDVTGEGVTGPYVDYFTLFTLNVTGAPSSLTLSDISFQYGTALDDPNIPPPPPSTFTPLPPTGWLLGSGLLGLLLLGRRRKTR